MEHTLHNIMDEEDLIVSETIPKSDHLSSWIYLLFFYTAVHLAFTLVKRLFFPKHQLPNSDGKRKQSDMSVRGMKSTCTFESLKSQCVPKEPPVARFPRAGPASYGLCADEQSAGVLFRDNDASDRFENEDLTTREVRKLQQMQSFKEWCVRNKMDSAALQDVFSRIHLYKKLKEIHPASFWALCSDSSLKSIDVVDPGMLVSLTEYLLSRLCDIGVAYSVYWYNIHKPSSMSGVIRAMLVFMIYCFVIRHWMHGRSTGSSIFSAWYETSHLSEQYRTSSGIVRTSLACILEDIFVVGTCGIGILVSVYCRCFSANKQCIGERIAGVRLIVEKTIRLNNE